MRLHVIDFSPPMEGFESLFNTFRLGTAWSKRVQVGEQVLLMDNKQHIAFGMAEVVSIKVGALGEMAALHAGFNHNYIGKDDAADKLIAGTIKRYGPHRTNVDKKYTVIYLRRVEVILEHPLPISHSEASGRSRSPASRGE